MAKATLIAAKTAQLLNRVDWQRPGLAALKREADPAAGLLAQLQRPPRSRFRFEYERKADMLDFLRRHYHAWRKFDYTAAKRLATMTIPAAQGPRALASIPELGQAWWASGDPAWGRAFERFYLAVPTGEMFNWDNFNGIQGAIELDAFFLLQDCEGFSREGRIAFLDHLLAITDDAWHTHTSTWRQTMLGPEGHNWYLHGMRVLPFTGLLFPEFKNVDFLLRSGMSIVEEHVRGHYRADGGARETTLGYQVGSMINLWDFYLVAQRNGFPLSRGFVDRLLEATLFLLRLMTPQGGIPSFGDSGHTPGGLTEMAAVAAALSGDGECKWYAEQCRRQQSGAQAETVGEIPLCAFWAVGLTGAATYAATRERNPQLSSVLMGPSGFAALRQGAGVEAAYMAITAADRGPIVTSHGHNDVFSLDVHAGGVRFIGEMGCAPYGTTPGRVYDELTEAHSCLAITGMEQAPLRGEWRWAGHVIPAVRRWLSTDSLDFFHGVHEGYYRYPEHSTLHARKVLFMKGAPAYWLIFDWLESDVENDVAVYFHGCVPGLARGDRIRLGAGGGTQLTILPPAGDKLRAEPVWNDGLAAYVAEKGLQRENYPCFAYRRKVGAHCFVWALVPGAGQGAVPVVKRLAVRLNGKVADPVRATAVEVTFRGQVDTVCLSHTEYDANLAFGGFESWGMLAVRRAARHGDGALCVDYGVVDGVCGR